MNALQREKDRCMTMSRLIAIVMTLTACNIARAADGFAVPANVVSVIDQHCTTCHGAKKQKGEVRLDTLASLNAEARNDLLNRVQEALHFEEMPPEEAKQPTPTHRKMLADWVRRQLESANASKLTDKLRRPEYGNYVDHHQLFSGEHADLKGFTFDRRWLISEYIFDAKFNRILNHNAMLNIDGQRQSVIGSNNRRVNLTNPFLLPNDTGVRYYANETLNGGHLLTMITNAKEAASYMVYLSTRDRRYIPAVADIMAQQWEHERVLASREQFLNQFIERILVDLYQNEHESLLPTFAPVDVEPITSADGEATKKAPFHAANPGRDELEIIFRSMRRLQKEGDTDAQLIAKCERDWFNFGHNERKIQARVTFLHNYMEEWRKQIEQHNLDQRHRQYEYRPPSDEELQAITRAIRKHRQKGDRYNTIIRKCLAQWEAEFKQARIDAGPPETDLVATLVEQLFIKILERSPTAHELGQYVPLTQSYVANMGNQKAIEKLIQTLLLRSDFVYRYEFGQGEADESGRRMLSPRDASYAIAYALTDSSPDEQLAKAAQEGRLNTREDYEREVRRMLSNRDQFYVIDESVNKPNDIGNVTNLPIRKLRFFREFFGYPTMLPIFKDNKRFGANYDNAKRRLVTEADLLVEHILKQDKDVFNQLLTTDKFYVFHSGDNEAMQASADRIRRIYDYFKDKDWQNFEVDDLAEHKDFIAQVKMRGIDPNRLEPGGRYNPLNAFKTAMTSFTLRLDKGQSDAAPYNSFPAHGMANAQSRLGGRLQSPEVAKFFNVDMEHWDYPATQPARLPHRKGMLTHPAWLIAHAQNTETDPVRRGKWIREKLLADTVPDLPITVDAVIPQDPHKTLRQRLEAKTQQAYCWKCHKKMNPLGLPFEMYDDFGRYRTQERLEYPQNLIEKVKDKGAPHEDLRDIYKTLPVEALGRLDGTGDESLDGEVTDAIDLIDRLARSQRVRQSIIRHAFRYYLGRNEMLSDSKTLIDADRAYVESGGSFDAVIVSLLTSDSFIYRKPIEN